MMTLLPALLALTLAGEFVIRPMPHDDCLAIKRLVDRGQPYSAQTQSVATWVACGVVRRFDNGQENS